MVLSSPDVKKALKSAILRLKKAGIESPVLDAEVLLAFAFKKPKEYLYSHPETELTPSQIRLFRKLIARRAKHEPVAYLTGIKEFFGLDFIVNRNVLIPRPETELIVEEVLKIIKEDPLSLPLTKGEKVLIDIGTGSGCIPIAVVKNSGIPTIAIDTSSAALKIAQKNSKRNGITKNIKFIKNDLLKNWKLEIGNWKLVILTANLPYLPTSEWRAAPMDVKKYEPQNALDGGKDGLKYYRELLPQIKRLSQISQIPIICLFEFCPEEKNALKRLVCKYFPNPSPPPFLRGRTRVTVEIKKDLTKRDRLLILEIVSLRDILRREKIKN